MTAVTFGFPTAGSLGPSHATIGTFDGLHRGHLVLLKTLIAGTRRSHFARLEAQLREALDSFRLLDRNGRPDW